MCVSIIRSRVRSPGLAVYMCQGKREICTEWCLIVITSGWSTDLYLCITRANTISFRIIIHHLLASCRTLFIPSTTIYNTTSCGGVGVASWRIKFGTRTLNSISGWVIKIYTYTCAHVRCKLFQTENM